MNEDDHDDEGEPTHLAATDVRQAMPTRSDEEAYIILHGRVLPTALTPRPRCLSFSTATLIDLNHACYHCGLVAFAWY